MLYGEYKNEFHCASIYKSEIFCTSLILNEFLHIALSAALIGGFTDSFSLKMQKKVSSARLPDPDSR